MRLLITTFAAAACIVLAGDAYASDYERCVSVPGAARLPTAELLAALSPLRITDVQALQDKRSGCIETYARDAQGRRVEITLDPYTGALVEYEREDEDEDDERGRSRS